MTTWNIADLFEQAAGLFPDREALVVSEQRRTFAELHDRSDRLAGHLRGLGVGPGDLVAVYAENGAEWAETMLAAYKIRAAPMNVNYRYTARELTNLLNDARPAAIVFQSKFAPTLREVAVPVSVVHGGLIEVLDDTAEPLLEGAASFAAALAGPPISADGDRGPDDIYVMYTGGTTGSPKGVLWRHEDVLRAHGVDVDSTTRRVVEQPEEIGALSRDRDQTTIVALGQFMHANGTWSMLKTVLWGNRVVMQRTFDPPAVWAAIERERADTLGFVGDAMGRPLIESLAADRDAYDLRSLRVVASAAATFTRAVQERFFELLPGVTIVETIGSSESGSEGSAPVTRGADAAGRAGPRVAIGPGVALVDEANHLIELVPGTVGRLARTGSIALGYRNDPAKTATTFPVIDGRRWCIPGDYAEVVDGRTILLMGRGSVSINTGGEKVFAEEVEAALTSHPAVYDAVVVGIADERWGQAVVGVVQARPGHQPDAQELRDHCRTTLAGYKVPKRVLLVDKVERSPSGKPDYAWARSVALAASTSDSTDSDSTDSTIEETQ